MPTHKGCVVMKTWVYEKSKFHIKLYEMLDRIIKVRRDLMINQKILFITWPNNYTSKALN